MPVQVPFTDDYAVLARLVLVYNDRPTRPNLAAVVLAQRVLIERAHRRRKPRVMAEVRETMDRIISSPETARAYAAAPGNGRGLAQVYPLYLQSGLVPRE